MKSGRDREVDLLVRYTKAYEVASLLTGDLRRPIREVKRSEFIDLHRRDIKHQVEWVKEKGLPRAKLTCTHMFKEAGPDTLVEMYQPIFDRGSIWHLPLTDYIERFGRPTDEIIAEAPLHSVVHITPMGFAVDFPEWLMMRDLAISWNDAVETDWNQDLTLLPFQLTDTQQEAISSLSKSPEALKEAHASGLQSQSRVRQCILTCFNLVEAYLNGIAWDYDYEIDGKYESNNQEKRLTESHGFVSLRDKLLKYPKYIAGKKEGPLDGDEDPLQTFLKTIVLYRDSLVHSSPFPARKRYKRGEETYSKLEKLFEIDIDTARRAINVTLELIGRIHQYLRGSGELPKWVPERDNMGRFKMHPLFFKERKREPYGGII